MELTRLNFVVGCRWNTAIIDALTNGCVEELKSSGVKRMRVVEVPGAFELPLACKKLLAMSHQPIDAVIGNFFYF